MFPKQILWFNKMMSEAEAAEAYGDMVHTAPLIVMMRSYKVQMEKLSDYRHTTPMMKDMAVVYAGTMSSVGHKRSMIVFKELRA